MKNIYNLTCKFFNKSCDYLHKLALMQFLMLVLIIFTAIPVFCEQNISAILSIDTPQYREVLAGYKDHNKEKNNQLKFAEHFLNAEQPDVVTAAVKNEKPEVILAVGKSSLDLAGSLNAAPVVFSMVSASAGSIPANAYGVSSDVPSSIKIKQLKKILPKFKTIGVIYSPSATAMLGELSQACKESEVAVISQSIASESEFAKTLDGILSQIDCFIMIPDAKVYFSTSVKYLILACMKSSIPLVGLSRNYTQAGALISLECNYSDVGRQMAEIADQVKAGQKPEKIVSPRKTKVSVNLTVSEKIGIKIPESSLGDSADIIK